MTWRNVRIRVYAHIANVNVHHIEKLRCFTDNSVIILRVALCFTVEGVRSCSLARVGMETISVCTV